MRANARVGLSGTVLAAAIIAVLVVAGAAVYLTQAPSGKSTTVSSTSASAPPQVAVTLVPPTPMISPGETQNYTLIQLVATGSALTGTVVAVRAFAPSGLSLALNASSLPISASPHRIPTVMKAGPGIAPGNYTVTIETALPDGPGSNQTFTVQVVPMLIIMQDLAFHPSNVTVPSGTKVTWLNLDSQIGCCDPGEHDVSFTTGVNYTSVVVSQYQSTSYTFGSEGDFYYYCTIHPFMIAQVVVAG